MQVIADMKNLDEIDLKIIRLLRENGRMSLKELSSEVFLTPPAVAARIEKLGKEGYIKGIHARLNMEKLGYGIKAFILVSVPPEKSGEFYDFIKQQECVLEGNHITGEYSMLLKVIFRSTTLLDEFMGKLQQFGKQKRQWCFPHFLKGRKAYYRQDQLAGFFIFCAAASVTEKLFMIKYKST